MEETEQRTLLRNLKVREPDRVRVHFRALLLMNCITKQFWHSRLPLAQDHQNRPSNKIRSKTVLDLGFCSFASFLAAMMTTV